MLYGIDGSISIDLQKKFEVRKKLMQLGKKYRKIDRNMKKGLIQMEKNFLYYLNEGSNIEDLVFFFNSHNSETRSLLAQWSNADKNFNRILNGRKLVLEELKPILVGDN